jgi:hypothetical protein
MTATVVKHETGIQGIPQSAAVLAYAGALPLIVSALLVVVRPETYGEPAQSFMIAYGGMLIVFFGGVRWGVAVMRPAGPTFASLVGGVLPLLAALPIFLLGGDKWKFAFIIAMLPILLFDDLKATRRGSGAPDWYLGVRAPLTILMEFSFLVAFAQIMKA